MTCNFAYFHFTHRRPSLQIVCSIRSNFLLEMNVGNSSEKKYFLLNFLRLSENLILEILSARCKGLLLLLVSTFVILVAVAFAYDLARARFEQPASRTMHKLISHCANVSTTFMSSRMCCQHITNRQIGLNELAPVFLVQLALSWLSRHHFSKAFDQ